MKTARPPTEQIDVGDLKVGMYVHLDMGWMSHPFPLSHFRIATPAQLATIRSLGVRKVRWSPQQSDASFDGGPAATLPGPLPGSAARASTPRPRGRAGRRSSSSAASPARRARRPRRCRARSSRR
jgi:hypothetical protein